MELNQLRTFVTVAEEKHLTRAADRLFTSQPAISAQLKALEEALGLKLFDRTPKGMQLTPAGEKLLVKAQMVLDAAGSIMTEAKHIQGAVLGQLSVGINSDMAFLKLPQLVNDATENYPDLTLSFVSSMSADILVDVRQGKLDTGFFFGPCTTGGLQVFQVAEVETAVVAPKAWADRVLYAELEELAQMPWIYTTDKCPFYLLKQSLFEHSKIQPSKAVYVDGEDAIRELVKSGSGIALLRKDDALRAEAEGWGIRWKGRTPNISLSVAMQMHRTQDPLMQAWLELLAKFWPMDSVVDNEASAAV